MSRPYSIIIWGATGFTGELVAEYFAESAPKDITFAIAGRNASKLESVYNRLVVLNPKLKGSIGKIIADSRDEKSLDAMVKQADVIVTTVGPYAKYGLPLVDSCVRNGTDYVDLTGEPQFIKQSILNYHEKALQKGVSIVHSCGFDSIPSDLGVFLMANYFKSKGLTLDNARYQLIDAKGTASGGTVHSMIEIFNGSSYKELSELGSNQNFLIPGKKRGNAWGTTTLYYDKALKSYQTPFIMEGANAKLVRRTNSLLGYNKQNFQYLEGVKASNIFSALFMTFAMSVVGICILFSPCRWMLGKLVPPGSGPDLKTRKNGFFHIKIVGEAKTIEGKSVNALVTVRGEGDPGYDATSRMIAESAICLVLDKKKRKGDSDPRNFPLSLGGVITPASAMGNLLVNRLNRSRIVFTLSNQEE